MPQSFCRSLVMGLAPVVLSVLTVAWSPSSSSAASTPAAIQVTNYKDGEVLRYTAPMLTGTLEDKSLTQIVVTNLSSKRDTRQITGMAHDGQFKALTDLVPGTNQLELKAGNQTIQFQLTYQPQTNPRFIRAVWFTDNTGDTKYSTPLPNDPQDYQAKFDTILKIMQSYTADWMNHYGYGRRTFNLELGPDGKVIVHVVKGSHPADYYRYKLNRDQLYDIVTDETRKGLSNAPSVDCTLIAFSSMDPKTGHSVAYTALGGGKIALFGGACVYSFPDSIADVQKAFTNPTLIDYKKYVSDSVGRNTFWGTASTSIGAMLHEMGHSMGLPHSDDPRDIMTRGIDNFGRYWVFYDPPSMRNPNTVYFKPNQVGYWSPESAAALAPTTWLMMDGPKVKPPEKPAKATVTLSPDGREFTITDSRGIGFIGYEEPGRAHSFHKIDLLAPLPTTLNLSAAEVFAAVGKGMAQFRIIDGDGHMSQVNLNEYGWNFVRHWHFSPKTMPWPDTTKFPDVSDAQLAELYQSAMKQPIRKSQGSEMRLPHSDGAANTATYAAIEIQSPAEQNIQIHTGSHDGIRVWVNGKLVTQVLKTRKAKPDSDVEPATLKAGANQVLVEVTHHDTKGAFYFRMSTGDGYVLGLQENGTLTKVKQPQSLQAEK